MEGTAVRVDSAGLADRSLLDLAGETPFSGSFFSTAKAIREPPRTPPSQDKKQAKTDPVTRMVPAIKVGRM